MTMHQATGEDELLWNLVHAAIDRREDPLADMDLALQLTEVPEVAAEVVRLMVDLEDLPAEASEQKSGTIWRRASYLKVATILFAALILWRYLPIATNPASNTKADQEVLVFRRGVPLVSYTLERIDALGSTRVRCEGDLITSEFSPRRPHRLLSLQQDSLEQVHLSPGDALTYTRVSTNYKDR